MTITGTHINYYRVCKRKLWLFANGIQMEHTSDLVAEGKLIHDFSYPQRAEKYTELELDGVKIDFYDATNKVVHEVKKSNKVEEAHLWQVKYYLYVLRQNGIEGATGILEYPKLRRRQTVTLSEDDVRYLSRVTTEIERIIRSDKCPERVAKTICRKCSYHDFCWSEELPDDASAPHIADTGKK
jgi:CRISPR-associated exonuclease Cas4